MVVFYPILIHSCCIAQFTNHVMLSLYLLAYQRNQSRLNQQHIDQCYPQSPQEFMMCSMLHKYITNNTHVIDYEPLQLEERLINVEKCHNPFQASKLSKFYFNKLPQALPCVLVISWKTLWRRFIHQRSGASRLKPDQNFLYISSRYVCLTFNFV